MDGEDRTTTSKIVAVFPPKLIIQGSLELSADYTHLLSGLSTPDDKSFVMHSNLGHTRRNSVISSCIEPTAQPYFQAVLSGQKNTHPSTNALIDSKTRITLFNAIDPGARTDTAATGVGKRRPGRDSSNAETTMDRLVMARPTNYHDQLTKPFSAKDSTGDSLRALLPICKVAHFKSQHLSKGPTVSQ